MADDGVPIGEAAARYGLTPATLRWWERQGVLEPPRRVGRARRYTARHLRQIGLAHLCCQAGRMPLDLTAVLTSRGTDRVTWRRTVREQKARLQREIAELTAAHDHLDHLLRCPHEVVVDCPHLDRDTRTPTAGRPVDDAGDGAPAGPACPGCGREVVASSRRGRPRRYCSDRCRQRVHRARRVS